MRMQSAGVECGKLCGKCKRCRRARNAMKERLGHTLAHCSPIRAHAIRICDITRSLAGNLPTIQNASPQKGMRSNRRSTSCTCVLFLPRTLGCQSICRVRPAPSLPFPPTFEPHPPFGHACYHSRGSLCWNATAKEKAPCAIGPPPDDDGGASRPIGPPTAPKCKGAEVRHPTSDRKAHHPTECRLCAPPNDLRMAGETCTTRFAANCTLETHRELRFRPQKGPPSSMNVATPPWVCDTATGGLCAKPPAHKGGARRPPPPPNR